MTQCGKRLRLTHLPKIYSKSLQRKLHLGSIWSNDRAHKVARGKATIKARVSVTRQTGALVTTVVMRTLHSRTVAVVVSGLLSVKTQPSQSSKCSHRLINSHPMRLPHFHQSRLQTQSSEFPISRDSKTSTPSPSRLPTPSTRPQPLANPPCPFLNVAVASILD
mgnify:CR=1 FL=1